MGEVLLVLEDGKTFAGTRFGADVDVGGEVVFNTSLIGYQEILGDPSYARQMVVMTYPMIGNYGIVPEDHESRSVFASALIVKEVSNIASNWRHRMTLPDYLRAQGIPGMAGLDTRALVKHLRTHGSKRGVIASAQHSVDALVLRARGVTPMQGLDLAHEVSVTKPYVWNEPGVVLHKSGVALPRRTMSEFHVVVFDFGAKRNILRCLVDLGCRITVVPARTTAQEVMDLAPDGVMLSNGPGDPEPMLYAIEAVRGLLGKVPVFGICLGHQLLCLAAGAKSYKLKFGHRGGNHPVMDLSTRKVEITSQNHGFAIDETTLPAHVETTHVNLNDRTLEGVRFTDVPAFSVQYHPEAAPGPHDAHYLFQRFAIMMREHRTLARMQGVV